jgi:hypothetical protein
MVGSHDQSAREAELERLLRDLLDEEPLGSGGTAGEVCPEALELRDMARRLRAATQWVPLPEGRQALRRALLAGAGMRGRRTRGWTLGAAAALLVAFGLGAGWVHGAATPSSPWYDLKLAVEDLQIAVLPTPVSKAEMLVRATHQRIAEIQAMATADDAVGLRHAARALDKETEWLREIIASLPVAERERVDHSLDKL